MVLLNYIHTISDFPKKKVLFRDISPLLADKDAFAYSIAQFKKIVGKIDNNEIIIAGIESRGFLFAAPLAIALGVGCMMIRKAHKLPPPCCSIKIKSEYNSQMYQVKAGNGEKVILVDDVLATGRTLKGIMNLLVKANYTVVDIICLIQLCYLFKENKMINNIQPKSIIKIIG